MEDDYFISKASSVRDMLARLPSELAEAIKAINDSMNACMKDILNSIFGLCSYNDEMFDYAYIYDDENDLRIDRFFNGAHYINRSSVRSCKSCTKQSRKPTPNKNYPYRRCDRSR